MAGGCVPGGCVEAVGGGVPGGVCVCGGWLAGGCAVAGYGSANVRASAAAPVSMYTFMVMIPSMNR